MHVLFLLSGLKMGYTLPHWHGEATEGPLPRAKFHFYRGKNVGIQPPKLSKFRILAINLPLRGNSFEQLFTKFSAFVRVYR